MKTLEAQNLQLLEKNQSDVVGWKGKEKDYKGKISELEQ